MNGRHEFKYIINEALAAMILDDTGGRLIPDLNGDGKGEYQISSLYYDTDNLELYHQTYNRDAFRVKLRLRVYDEKNTLDSISFFETKSKLCGRSVKMRGRNTLGENLALAEGRRKPSTSFEKDVVNLIQQKHLHPTAIVSYRRRAFLDPDRPRLRVTFDSGLRVRMDDLDLTHGTYGTMVMGEDMLVLEVKNDENIPKWLCEILAKYKLMNQCYSKYGQVGQLIQESRHPAAGVYVAPRPITTRASGDKSVVQMR